MSKESRELLVHASMHAMVGPGLGGGPGKVAPVGRILLQTGVQNSTKYQEAVAAALANELKVKQQCTTSRAKAVLIVIFACRDYKVQ